MADLKWRLIDLGLQKYHEVLVNHGFGSWQRLLSVTEEDMARMDVKRGHRRLLQRAIARFQGKADWEPLDCPSFDQDSSDRAHRSGSALAGQLHAASPLSTIPSKRKYLKRPPKDLHAPQRPRTGYVLFANFLRQNSQISDLEFADMARLVGHQWRNLPGREQNRWKSEAAEQKRQYDIEASDYRNTRDYQEFQESLQKYRKNKRRLDCGANSQPQIGINRAEAPRYSMASTRTESADEDEEFYRLCPAGSQISMSNFSTLQSVNQDCIQFQLDKIDVMAGQTICGPFSKELQDVVVNSYQAKVSQIIQPATDDVLGSLEKDISDLFTGHYTQQLQGGHIQGVNPFHTLPRTVTWPLFYSSLQSVNNLYSLLDSEQLVQQFLLVTDVNNALSSSTMSTLCLCISIGCQVDGMATKEMATQWHHYGWGYLNSSRWGIDGNTAKAFMLIGLFDLQEKPAAAHRYLGIIPNPDTGFSKVGILANTLADIALRIGMRTDGAGVPLMNEKCRGSLQRLCAHSRDILHLTSQEYTPPSPFSEFVTYFDE